MKLSDRCRFPHPVLWAQSGDYVQGQFAITFDGSESLRTGELILEYSVLLDDAGILALLRGEQAAIGVFVTCPETYYSRLISLSHSGGRFSVPGGNLRGRVILRPIVWSAAPATLRDSGNIHHEFGDGEIPIPKGALIAIGDEEVLEVGRDKLANIESIFAMAVNDEVPHNQIAIQLDDEKIQILAARQTYEKIHRLRGTLTSQAIVLNSIYLPAVIDVLSCLKEAPADYEGRRWHRVVMAKLRHLGLDVESGDLLQCAQTILSSPFGTIPDDLELRAL